VAEIIFAFGIISLVIFIAFFVCTAISVIAGDSTPMEIWKNKYRSLTKKIFYVILLVNLIGITKWFIPTTKEVAVFIVAPRMINNSKVQQIPKNILDLVNEWIEELKPSNDARSCSRMKGK
jgi:hypothetical protein